MGLVAAWLAGLLLVFPARLPGGRQLPWLRGPVAASSARVAAYAEARLVSGLPEPSRIFENLGPDRYRREIFRSLRSQTDAHVDEQNQHRCGHDLRRGHPLILHIHQREAGVGADANFVKSRTNFGAFKGLEEWFGFDVIARYKARLFYPPPEDIRIAIRSFQI